MKACEDISTFITEEKEEEKESAEETCEKPKVDSEANETKKLLPDNNGPKESEETAEQGTVSKNVYWGYAKAGANLCSGLVLVISTFCTHACISLSDMWIRRWTNTEDTQLQDYHHHLNQTTNNDTLVQELHTIEESNQHGRF